MKYVLSIALMLAAAAPIACSTSEKPAPIGPSGAGGAGGSGGSGGSPALPPSGKVMQAEPQRPGDASAGYAALYGDALTAEDRASVIEYLKTL